MRRFATLADFAAASGEHLGYSAWREVTQQQVDMFADVTGDRQWIDTDPACAAAGPFGATIAHGYLTLALVTVFISEIFRIDDLTMGINIGLNRVRFPAPVTVGSRVRGGAQLISLKPSPAGTLDRPRHRRGRRPEARRLHRRDPVPLRSPAGRLTQPAGWRGTGQAGRAAGYQRLVAGRRSARPWVPG